MIPILQLNNICKRFGGVVTADNITFDLYPGTITGLIGPNGAGKSTLMNLISGIYSCDDGTIIFDGKEVTKTPSHKRASMGLARTFQTPRFLQRSNLRDNLMLGVDLRDQIPYVSSFFGKKETNLEKELMELMEIAGFQINLEDDESSITYGQRKLLEIIRSMLTKPKVMLVDEPAAGLNSREIENAMALLNLAAKKYNIAVLLIEHSMDMIMNTCSNIIVISFGKMIGTGTPQEVSTNPQVIEAYLGGGFCDAQY